MTNPTSTSPSIYSALKKLRFLLSKKEKLKWLGIVCFALSSSIFEIITATLIVIFAQSLNAPEIGQNYLNKFGINSVTSPARVIFYISIAVGIVYLIKNIIACIEVFFQNFTIQKMNYNFKNKLLNVYANTDYNFYLTRNSSLGSQIVGGDIEQMFSSGMVGMATLLSESVVFICLISMIVYMNPSLALIIFGIFLSVFGILTKLVFPKFYKWGIQLQEASQQTSQNLLQFFHGFKEIILLGKTKAFIDAFYRFSFKKSKVQALQTAVNAVPRILIETLFVFIFVIAICVLCLEHESPSSMLGVLGGYLYAGFRLMPGLNRMINQLNVFKYVIPCIERVYKEYSSNFKKESYLDITDFVFEKNITLKNVSFKYLNTKKDSLKNINLEIKKGEKIGIVGQTGSGKSTLVDVILGLLKPYEGSVLVDNKYPVNSYQWHKKIGYVPQSIYLTDDTIEANIAFGENKIDYNKLNMAIESAQLSKFINALPEGLKTFVGERGIRLSGGERQRISIARALYNNPDVLIFDEATSALDNETEGKLMQTINDISKNRTVIMIAHRLSTLESCDRIIEVDGGKVI